MPGGAARGLRVHAHAIDIDGSEARVGTAQINAGGRAGAAVAHHLHTRQTREYIGHAHGARSFNRFTPHHRHISHQIGQRLLDAIGGDHGFFHVHRIGLRS